MEAEKLDLGNIIEIQQIISILKQDESLYKIFMMLLKIVNKKVNNEKLEELIDDETPADDDLSSNSSYDSDYLEFS